MSFLTYSLTIAFPAPGYVGHPYWPAMARVIDITKESGVNRARSPANRRKALEEHLKSIGMTLAQYEALEAESRLPFHTTSAGEIIIPGDKFQAFLVETCDTIRSAGRPCPPEQVRSRIKVSDLLTGKTEPDGVWERYAVVSSGAGQKLSNQRGLRRSSYIQDFTARGTITFNADFVKPDTLRNAIAWGGENVGVGAARKMGRGRFTLDLFAEQVNKIAAE